ncbi:uncharacterized protein LOC111984818 [Quercus suber]|uniref:uncharacterized protein LOC111984818 n=1 Tax=Quercus suber TaxID=58331 RepID=UPI000CE17761|nr:uncharacterized protein LOC111984818 [Quercus suber]
MVSTWIINSVSPKLQASIIYRDATLEIWIDLRDTFSQGNGTKVFNIQKQIADIHQGEQSLTDYFAQLKRLKSLQAKESTMKFLMGVNDAFSQVRTQILLMDQFLSINKAHSLFIQEEMQRPVTNSIRVESTVLATKSSGNNSKGNERPLCTYCGKLGHTVDKWYKLHGFPLGYKFKNKNVMAYQVSSTADQSQGHHFALNPNHNSVAAQAPAFTPD